MSELGRRVLSALLLGSAVLLLLWWGNPGFAVLLAAAAAIMVWEWSGITRKAGADAAMIAAGAGAALAVLAAAAGWWMTAVILVAAGGVLGQAVAGFVGGNRLLWLGVVYAALPACALAALRDDPEWGLVAVLWLLVIVWATDIGAYFAGRAIGGPKLWPAVSPKKTWAGALGGGTAALVVGMGVAYLALPGIGSPWALAAVIVILSIAGQLGDLAESALKRHFGVKDSSTLIPGHGGLMDRVDGVVAAALVAGVLGMARGGPEAPGGGLLLW